MEISDLQSSALNHENATCETCGNAFMSASMTLLGAVIRTRHCEPCIAKHDADMRAAQETAKAEPIDRWAKLCPREYRLTTEGGETDLERLQRDCPKLPEILAWRYGPTGLLLRGTTGRCKTRSLWRVLRRCHDEHRDIIALTAGQFGREYADAGGNHTLNDWFRRLATVDVLMIDEVGNAAWTDGAEATFFDLVENRGVNGKPLLTATNHDGDTLETKLRDEVRAKPLIRRLRSYCTSINLNP